MSRYTFNHSSLRINGIEFPRVKVKEYEVHRPDAIDDRPEIRDDAAPEAMVTRPAPKLPLPRLRTRKDPLA